MFRNFGNRQKGFTLIELAIVLTIAGLLFAGLWRLLSGGNQQVRDQSAAAQQTQLIAAVRGYLADSTPLTGGVAFLTAMTANQAKNLALPTTVNCAAGIPAAEAPFCNYLPAGFFTGTPNSYGQTYTIQLLKDGSPAGTPPNSYSFMILTSGGDTIPDTSGGRISASIGNDGGFIYSNNICNAQSGVATNLSACGAYGTWAVGLATYGLGAQVGGQIASRSYSTPSANAYPWLARPVMPGDAPNYIWNTMQTDLYMGGTAAVGGSAGNIYMLPPNGSPAEVSTVSGNIFMNGPGLTTGGGTINLEGGVISGIGVSGISLTGITAPPGTNAGTVTLSGNQINAPSTLISATNGCGGASGVNAGGVLVGPGGCNYSIIADNIEATNFMYASSFYAPSFNYNTASDIRFKKDIEPLKNSLADIMQIKPVAYRLKTADEKSLKNMGVIAQELEKIYPQLVTTGDMKYVKYEGLIAPLIGAVQELKEENDRLRQELQAQKKRQDELEKKVGLSESDKHP